MKKISQPLIVITGGAGFIGSCFVRYLNDQGIDHIVIVDKLGKSEKWKNLVGKRFYHFIEKESFFPWLKEHEALVGTIIHLGACTDTMENDAAYLVENNYQFSVNLAEFALSKGKRFIYASSAATYGNGAQGFNDDCNQLFHLSPLNMYGYSKQLFDQWAKMQGVLDQIVGLKFFNVFGPNEWHKGRMASAVIKMVQQIEKKEAIKLFKTTKPNQFADGEQKRDFIYVKDVVKMIYPFLTNQVGGLFNIGSAIASTWNELAKAVCLAMNEKINIEYIDMPKELVEKYQNYSCADMSKTKKTIGHHAACVSLNEAVHNYVNHHLLTHCSW